MEPFRHKEMPQAIEFSAIIGVQASMNDISAHSFDGKPASLPRKIQVEALYRVLSSSSLKQYALTPNLT